MIKLDSKLLKISSKIVEYLNYSISYGSEEKTTPYVIDYKKDFKVVDEEEWVNYEYALLFNNKPIFKSTFQTLCDKPEDVNKDIDAMLMMTICYRLNESLQELPEIV